MDMQLPLLLVIAISSLISLFFSGSHSFNLINSNAISALLGAIIGSVTGYFFNQKLEERKTKERLAIQKKNTIFSPVYKELLLLKDYLKDVKSGEESYCRIDFKRIGDEAFGHSFAIWESIKKDVRYDYIPDSLKGNLERLTELLKEKMRVENIIPKKCDEIAQEFSKSNQHKINFDLINNLHMNFEGSLSHQIYATLGIMRYEKGEVKNFLEKYLLDQYKNESDQLAKNLEHRASSLEEYHQDKATLDQAIVQLDKTIEDSRTLITAIINKYEGGINYV